MTEKELKHMNRGDLVEIIYQYQSREQELTAQIENLTRQLSDRKTHIENAGSIAEAALTINRVFESAQAAADQFLDEIRAANEDKEAQGQKIIAAAQAEADELRRKTQEECRTMTDNAKRECDAMYDQITKLLKSYEELRSLLPGRVTAR